MRRKARTGVGADGGTPPARNVRRPRGSDAIALDALEVLAATPPRRDDSRVGRLAAARRAGRSVAILPDPRRGASFIREALRDIRAAGFRTSTPVFVAGPAGAATLGSLGEPISLTGARVVLAGAAAAEAARRWRGQPLSGRRVVVTRAPGEGDALAARLSAAGAEVDRLPAIEVTRPADARPLRRALENLASFDWIVFTSRHAVEAALGESPRSGGRRVPGAGRPVCAAIGPSTARALERAGRRADLVPRRASAAGLVSAFRRLGVAGRRVLLPQSALASPELAAGLAALGATVTAVAAYSVRTPRRSLVADAVARIASRGGIDAFLLASGSAARGVRALLGRGGRPWPAIAIGASTASAARSEGFRVIGVASRPGDAALVALAIRLLGRKRRPAAASPKRMPLL